MLKFSLQDGVQVFPPHQPCANQLNDFLIQEIVTRKFLIKKLSLIKIFEMGREKFEVKVGCRRSGFDYQGRAGTSFDSDSKARTQNLAHTCHDQSLFLELSHHKRLKNKLQKLQNGRLMSLRSSG